MADPAGFITTAFVQQYSTNVMMLLQQQGTRFRNAVQNYAHVGKAATVVEQFGAVNPSTNLARWSDTPLTEVPQDRRWQYPTDYDWATMVDNQDRLRMLIDPTAYFTQAGVMAMGRAFDDEILKGFFGPNNVGETGATSTGPLLTWNGGSQVVAPTVGATAPTGLNVAKLRAAKKLLMQAEVDLDNDTLFCAITAQDHDNLMNEIQVVNTDYNNRPVLVDGRIQQFYGFNFIHSERVPGAPNFNAAANTSWWGTTALPTGATRLLPVWAKSGMAVGIWNDIQASVDRRPDKRNNWQVYLTATLGSTRIEEKRCVIIANA